MKTTLEVTLKIEVEHPNHPLDENSVKAVINTGTAAIARNRRFLSTIGDKSVETIKVSVVRFKENGRHQSLSLYGTDSVPWNH